VQPVFDRRPTCFDDHASAQRAGAFGGAHRARIALSC
jgi:hypothetical protein